VRLAARLALTFDDGPDPATTPGFLDVLAARGVRATFFMLVADATGAWPRFFRPPYGVLSGPSLLALRQLRLTPVLWGALGREWEAGATGDSVPQSLRRGLDGGVTVLLHDSDSVSPSGSAAALAAVPSLLDECAKWGLRVGPAGEHSLWH
jgi:peptidoglycan/xylan/chitin deacetylase (PgdA/CDA1 family)